MANYDSLDLDVTWDLDYIPDEDGDLKDTSEDLLLSLKHEIATVVKSEAFDWEKDITLGANLSDYTGEPNTRETGEALQNRVKSAITNQGIVQNQDLTVRVIPVHAHQVLIMIRVAAEASPGNNLVPGQQLELDLIYDTFENGIFFLLDNTLEKQALP